MGKAIIIQGADWSAKNLGRVTFIKTDELTIMGMTSIDGVAEYVAILGGNKVSAQWQVNDASIVELSATQGETITLTPLASGSIILSALYEGKTASVAVDVVVKDNNTITQNDLSEENLRYGTSSGNLRSVVYIPVDLHDVLEWSLNLSVSDSSNIKAAIQLHADELITSNDATTPSAFQTGKTAWDSGWINPGSAAECNQSNDWNNTIGTATYRGYPYRIALVFTYVEGGGFPPVEEFVNNVNFEWTLVKERGVQVITQNDLSADGMITTSNPRSLLYLDLQGYRKWHLNFHNAEDSTIKVGIQYHDYALGLPGATGVGLSATKTSWDSGWVTPGMSKECDETNNKSNTSGAANSSVFPMVIGLVFTPNNANSGTPTFEEFMQYITFDLTLEP